MILYPICIDFIIQPYKSIKIIMKSPVTSLILFDSINFINERYIRLIKLHFAEHTRFFFMAPKETRKVDRE